MRSAWPIQLGGVVIVASLIWLVVFSISYRSFSVLIPLEVVGLPSGLTVAESLTTVTATVRSQATQIAKVRAPGTIRAVLDLGSIATIGYYHTEPRITTELENAWVVNYHPQSFDITVVPIVQGIVELTPDVIGFPAVGYSLGEITISPASVVITGPGPVVQATSTALVPVNVNKAKMSFAASTQPEIRNAQGEKIATVAFLPSAVAVSVQVKPGESFKTVGLNPVFSGELQPGYWVALVKFEPPAVTLRGSAERLDAITSLLTTPINLSDRSADFSDKVSIEVPVGVTLVGSNLVSVSIKVRTASHNRKLVLLPSYTNITEGLSVTSLSPPTVTVILAGPPEKLSQLNRANTLLDLDLRGGLSGTNTVELAKEMFKVPDNVEVVSFQPESLEVTLTKSQ